MYNDKGLSLDHEEVACESKQLFQNMEQARWAAIEMAAKIFILMKDVHKLKGFCGVRWVIQEINESFLAKWIES
jgi:hypothetical protein